VNEPTEPAAQQLVEQLHRWLAELVQVSGSDLHVKVGSAPRIREEGRLLGLLRPPFTPEETDALAREVVPAWRRPDFDERGEVDFAYSVPGLGRFRVNAFRQRGSASLVFRLLRLGGQPMEELGLPPIVAKLAEEYRGLVLVTGPTGSGKTTTLAAMIEHINRSRPVHIVTIEDPIEVLHADHEALVVQREVGQDTGGFLAAIRAAMRQDPDVILIGEMRDPETVMAALQAAETGHLVLSTLHTTNAVETVNRVVDFFPPSQQNQARVTLASALRGIVCQRLVPMAGGGRIAAIEVLVNTGRVAERVLDPALTAEIKDVIREGGFYGMQSFDQSLLQLVESRRVDVDEAMAAASEPHDFQLMLQQAQLLPTG
jgi:twitching motility protein PilT